jgi:excisionase family DNA binding protein
MQQVSLGSRGLLTARQVQQMLHIDRSTVHRMASDGRLPSIRVGRQLRFPADQLGGLFEAAEAAETAADVDPAVAEAVIEVAAELLGVTMVVTDMAGHPLTAIVNPSPWFTANAHDEALGACLREWRAMADDPDLTPRFVMSDPGFECARAFIRSGSALIGMVLAGGIAAPESVGSSDFHHIDTSQRQTVLRALPRIAAAIAPGVALSARKPWHGQATLSLEESL